jgi:hypothetical protein
MYAIYHTYYGRHALLKNTDHLVLLCLNACEYSWHLKYLSHTFPSALTNDLGFFMLILQFLCIEHSPLLPPFYPYQVTLESWMMFNLLTQMSLADESTTNNFKTALKCTSDPRLRYQFRSTLYPWTSDTSTWTLSLNPYWDTQSFQIFSSAIKRYHWSMVLVIRV